MSVKLTLVEGVLSKEHYFSNIIQKDGIDLKNIQSCYELIYKGTKYKRDYYLSSDIRSSTFKLYKIKMFLYQNGVAYILCHPIHIKQFCSHFQSYKVGSLIDSLEIKLFSDFNTSPLHLYPLCNGKTYVRRKYVA